MKFAFVEFEKIDEAEKAIREFNDYWLDGLRIQVSWSKRSGKFQDTD